MSLCQHWNSCLGQGLEGNVSFSDWSPWHTPSHCCPGESPAETFIQTNLFVQFFDSLSFLTALPHNGSSLASLSLLLQYPQGNCKEKPGGIKWHLLVQVSEWLHFSVISQHSLAQHCSPQTVCGAGHCHHCHQGTRGKGQSQVPSLKAKGYWPQIWVDKIINELKNSHLNQMTGSERLSSAGKPNYSTLSVLWSILRVGTEVFQGTGHELTLWGGFGVTEELEPQGKWCDELTWQREKLGGKCKFQYPCRAAGEGRSFPAQSPDHGNLHRGWREVNSK